MFDDTFQIALTDNNVYINIKGEAVHKNSLNLKKFADETLSLDTETLKSFHISLNDVNYIDSTFIGILISIEKKINRKSKEHLIIHKPSERCKEILKIAGLLDFFRISDQPIPKNENYIDIKNYKIDKLEKAIIIYEAHDAISETNEENAAKFSLLKKVLSEEIIKLKNKTS